MAKPVSFAKKLRWRLEVIGLRCIMSLFAALPLDRASALGGWLLRRFGPGLPVQRVGRTNLELALPNLSADDRNRVLAEMWENLGRTAGEYPHLKEIVDEASQRVVLDLHPAFDAHRATGRAMIVASAHFANWEVMHLAAGIAGLDVVTVVRHPNNPLVRDRLEAWRSVTGGARVPKGREGARAAVAALKAGKMLAILADQRMSEGIDAEFFGLPAMTPAGPAQLALRTGCPLFPAKLERQQGVRFRLTIDAPIPVPEGLDRVDATVAMTQALNDRLEAWIREKPGDWLWLHRRWPSAFYEKL
ncbi:lysophospholipid acyltransferase family protein [Algihabitans albus]|uniref:lysophospholipid acyltransferase family protein n=1 Tax=Algihabitans albus TaxID=2164067 RepID=UPI0013C33C27|nr:lauroyl acyltransferase [Algihabitans albus]